MNRVSRHCRYEDTVIPEINIALLAGHDMLFLGEKGQAKSRLMRSLVRFLDEEIPTWISTACRCTKIPYAPITEAGKRFVAEHSEDQVPISWWPREQRYAERLSPGRSSRTSSVRLILRTDRRCEHEHREALHFGLIPRMHRGIFAMNELPELDELVQVGLFNIL